MPPLKALRNEHERLKARFEFMCPGRATCAEKTPVATWIIPDIHVAWPCGVGCLCKCFWVVKDAISRSGRQLSAMHTTSNLPARWLKRLRPCFSGIQEPQCACLADAFQTRSESF